MNNEFQELKTIYYNALSQLNLEKRYGHLIKKHSIHHELFYNLFISIMTDKKIKDIMKKLNDYDKVTFLHSLDVFLLSCIISIELDTYDVGFFRGSLLHDIGKLHIPLSILNKETRLTPEEFEVIQTHTILGADYLNKIDYKKEAILARSHHERLDGSGYPDGIQNEELSLHVRLLGILDVYSALTLVRPYKKAFTNQEAFDIMQLNMEHYDLELLNRFMNLILDNSEKKKVQG